MLHDFLTANRNELIERCKDQVAKRSPSIPAALPAIADKGVPLFLAQLVDTLRQEQSTTKRIDPAMESTPSHTDIGRAAALHGAELLRHGYSVDQVVHNYGDICQSVTDMVVEQKASVSADEFRTLNRCLDNAIADAVTAYARSYNTSISDQAKQLHKDAGSLKEEQLRLVDIAMQTYSAIRIGTVGLNGSTGSVLGRTLGELRVLIQQSPVQGRPVSATSTPALPATGKRPGLKKS